MLDELTHDRGERAPDEEPGRPGFTAALRSARRWVGRVEGVMAVLPSTREPVPTLEVWVEAGTPPGIVPGEHRGVPVVVREARGISAFRAETDGPRRRRPPPSGSSG
jgi:hypothetical protein